MFTIKSNFSRCLKILNKMLEGEKNQFSEVLRQVLDPKKFYVTLFGWTFLPSRDISVKEQGPKTLHRNNT